MADNSDHCWCTEAVLDDAWLRVRAKGGAPGVDGVTLDAFESGLTAQLAALRADVTGGSYAPQAYRGVDVPKASGGFRRLVITTVRDRVLQAAACTALLPHIAPLLHPCSFAYREGVGVQDALAKVAEYRDRGLEHVLRSDIERFFDTVDHAILETMLDSAGIPPGLAGLVHQWLTAAIASDDGCVPNTKGLPQGLPISPLLANLYLTPFDRGMVDAGWKLVRYADDFAVCCASRAEAERARHDAETILRTLSLALGDDKTSITCFEEGFTFLGAHFRHRDIVPTTPHPYEAEYTPPPRPRVETPPGVPHVLLRTLYIQQQGAYLGVHGGRLVVSRDHRTLLDVPAHHIDQVFIFGRVSLSTPAMAFCLRRGVPIHLFSGRGEYRGAVQPIDGADFVAERAQYRLLDETERRMTGARAIVGGKIANGLALLEQHRANHPETVLDEAIGHMRASLERLDAFADLDTLRGLEGFAAAQFYQGFSKCIRGDMTFVQRNRRPPRDPINSLLSFGYTLLLRHVQSYLAARGLDPAVGLFHQSGRGHPALASDLLEEFRAPVVEAFVLRIINRGQFTQADFFLGEGDPQPCLLRDDSRPRFFETFEAKLSEKVRHPEAAQPVEWRQVLDLQAARMKRFILGEVNKYEAFRV